MPLLSSSQLAGVLQVTPTRVGQYVREGKLTGCFTGEGRARRFDLDKVATALGRRLHPGQMMGNGAATRQAIRNVVTTPAAPRLIEHDEDDDDGDGDDVPLPAAKPARDGGELTPRDPDRYELARTQKAEEEARRLRRMNAEAEGTYVLAAEVERQVARMLAQEIAEFEAVLRDGSRRVADKLGVDFKAVRQLMMEQWRGHRAGRTEVLQAQADAADLTPAEAAGNI
jgi:hypothetical protein